MRSASANTPSGRCPRHDAGYTYASACNRSLRLLTSWRGHIRSRGFALWTSFPLRVVFPFLQNNNEECASHTPRKIHLANQQLTTLDAKPIEGPGGSSPWRESAERAEPSLPAGGLFRHRSEHNKTLETILKNIFMFFKIEIPATSPETRRSCRLLYTRASRFR
jgi:hypothetical protein